MIKNKVFFLFLLLVVFLNYTFSTSFRISQIDNTSLLLDQKIKVYISVTDESGVPVKNLKRGFFSLYESVDEKNYKEVEIDEFKTNANFENGISFLLLIDNSGSMYNDMNGKATRKNNKMRITKAKNAVIHFLNSIKNPEDKVGIASYNSFYTSYSRPISDKGKIAGYLDEIKIPQNNEGWTEIYSSLYLAADNFSSVKGRKAIIILSDGENMPYYKYVRKPHKEFGEKIFNYKEPIDKCLEEGVSVFAVNFGSQGEKKDKDLKKIATQTGGVVFNAYSQQELRNIYLRIMEQIQNEYFISYKAKMDPANKKYVKANFVANDEKKSAVRFYFSSMIFGLPSDKFPPLFLIPIIAALFLLWILSLIKFKNRRQSASLELLEAPVGTVIHKTLRLQKSKTIIGGTKNADMTIINAPKVKADHATIAYDKNNDTYLLTSKEKVSVNNKTVTKKKLEAGDVINVGGTIIVFDEGMMNNKKGNKKRKK